MAEALYRKYRPQIFEDVVGQEHIERTLKNAISADKVSHAYLFTGPRGTGKTTTARLLAKALLCESGPTPDPDGTCEDCQLVASGEHPDVYELDAASRTGVENVREEIIGRVNYAPTRGRYKVYIIDEVHMLSPAAFNALLKTLEEPPAHVVFVLCTTDPQKIPETIHSRCQRFDFRRISNEQLVSRLGAICEMEGIEFEGDALELIAHRAEGGMRDALTSLEQLIAFGEGNVTMEQAERLLGSLDSSDVAEIVHAIGTRDVAAAFRWTSEYMETGADLAQFVQDLAEHMRDMYVMQLSGADTALDITEAARRELQSESAWFGPDRLSNMLGVLGDLMSDLKTSTNQRLTFEIALTRMIRPDSDLTLAALAERVEELESGRVATMQTAPVNAGANMQQSVSVVHDSAPKQAAQPVNPQEEPAHPTTQAVQSNVQVAQPSAQSTKPVAQAGQPAVQPAASATKPDSGTAAALAQNPQFWPTVMAHLKKINQAYAMLLLNTQASIQDDTLTILFPQDVDFAFTASQKPQAKAAISDAIAQAGLPGISLAFAKTGEVQAAPVAAVSTTSVAASRSSVSANVPNADSAVTDTSAPFVADEVTTIHLAPSAVDEPEETHVSTAIEEDLSAPFPEDEPTADQLNDALSAAFGEGITFTPVD